MSIWKVLSIIAFIIPFITTSTVLILGASVKWYDLNTYFSIGCALAMAVFMIIGNLTKK